MTTLRFPSGTQAVRAACDVVVDVTEVRVYARNGNWHIYDLVRQEGDLVEVGQYKRTDWVR